MMRATTKVLKQHTLLLAAAALVSNHAVLITGAAGLQVRMCQLACLLPVGSDHLDSRAGHNDGI